MSNRHLKLYLIKSKLIYIWEDGDINFLKKYKWDLDGVAQWVEHSPANQNITSSIPNQGTCLSYGPGPQ